MGTELKIATDIQKDGFVYYETTDSSLFELSGVVQPSANEGQYYRLEYINADKYSEENRNLSFNLSGVQLRFKTNAESFMLYAETHHCGKMLHFSAKGAYGFDVYSERDGVRSYCGRGGHHYTSDSLVHDEVIIPEKNGEDFDGIIIMFPLYGGVKRICIGIPEGKEILPPRAFSIEKPVCFYGSSITQGGCVTRPANAFANLVTSELDCPCVNLGFSGSALGQQYAAEFISKLDLYAFVMDYDYNAPSVEHLRSTHYDFFQTVRTAQPDLPVIIMSHPYYTAPKENDTERKNVVYGTYLKAVESGDKNVYYIDSESYFPEINRDLYAVDNCHPNDLGHKCMADAILKVIKKL